MGGFPRKDSTLGYPLHVERVKCSRRRRGETWLVWPSGRKGWRTEGPAKKTSNSENLSSPRSSKGQISQVKSHLSSDLVLGYFLEFFIQGGLNSPLE